MTADETRFPGDGGVFRYHVISQPDPPPSCTGHCPQITLTSLESIANTTGHILKNEPKMLRDAYSSCCIGFPGNETSTTGLSFSQPWLCIAVTKILTFYLKIKGTKPTRPKTYISIPESLLKTITQFIM
jgi:hypothetical protein